MIGVDGYLVAFHLGYDEVDLAVLGLRGDHHSRLYALHILKRRYWHLLHAIFTVLTVGICGFDHDLEFIAHRLAFERLLETRNNISRAVQVGHRITTFRRVDHFLTDGICYLVVNRNNLVMGNTHVLGPCLGARLANPESEIPLTRTAAARVSG